MGNKRIYRTSDRNFIGYGFESVDHTVVIDFIKEDRFNCLYLTCSLLLANFLVYSINVFALNGLLCADVPLRNYSLTPAKFQDQDYEYSDVLNY